MAHKTFPKPAPKPKARKRPLPARSEKGQSYQDEYDAMKPLVHARSCGRCEARLKGCTVEATDEPHHRKLRSQGGKNDLATLLDVCLPCHNRIHGQLGEEAYRLGLLIRRMDPITPDQGALR